jgi:hypothetical protein
MSQLHPAVERLLHSGRYAVRPGVEGFTEHELKDRSGNVIRKVTKEDLEQFAKVNNQKAAAGALTPIGAGHTFDDEYDKDGKLVSKFPEEKQPKPFGYLYNYRVELNPHTGKYSLFHDEYIQRLVEVNNPETGKPEWVDGMRYSESFPRRSAEAYHNEHWIDWMAAIRRAPRLDLGVVAYAKANPERRVYADMGNEFTIPAVTGGAGKTRYSFPTGGDDGGESDPTKPPSAAPTAPAGGSPTPAPAAASSMLPPEHAEAAEQYARHAFGMHHTRCAKLMQHMHAKYAAECGMDGDMNTPYAMGAPSAMNAGPAPAAGPGGASPSPAPHPAPSPAAPTHPSTPATPEHAKMSQDQAAIEKERYERRLVELENGLASERAARVAAEAAQLHTRYERELMQLVYEGYEGVDAAKELEFVTKRKYSREQFDDHVAILRRLPKAPLGSSAPIDPESYTLRKPAGADAANDQKELYSRNFDKITLKIRQGKTNAEAFKEVTEQDWKGTNGVLNR